MAIWDCTPNGIFTTASFTNAICDALNDAEWSCTITPTNAFSTYSGYICLIGNGGGGVWIVNGQLVFFRDSDQAEVINTGTLGNNAGNPFTFTYKPVTRQLVVSGLTGAGNGTYSWSAPASGDILVYGSVGVGRYTDGGYTFAGTVGDVTYTTAALSLTADPGSVALTGTAASLVAGRRLTADAGAIAVTGTNAGLVGPSTYTLAANAGSFAITGTSNSFARTRVLTADAGALALAGTDATLLRSGGIEIGAHGKVVQLYGAGSNPASVTLTTTNGSTFLIFIGGKSSDIDTGPTDNKGNTYSRIDVVREYPDYAGYGQAAWICRNGVGGSSHTFSTFVTAFDECTMFVVEIKGAPFVASKAFSVQANSGAGATQNVGPVVATADCVLLSTWAGAGPVGTNHTASANQGLAELEFYGTDHPNGYVQMELDGAVKTSGSYTVTWSHTPNQGAILRAIVLQTMPVLAADAGATAIAGAEASLGRDRAPLEADPGAMAIAGTAAAFSASRVVAAAAGAVSLTGATAAVLAGRVVEASAGAAAVAGTDVEFRRGRVVAGDAGTLSLTGVAVGLRAGRTMVASSGGYVLGGTDATLAKTGAYTIGADAGAFTLTGIDATLTKSTPSSRTLVAASGALAIAGTAAQLAWSGTPAPPSLRIHAVFIDGIHARWDHSAELAAVFIDEEGNVTNDEKRVNQNETPKTIRVRAFTSEAYVDLTTWSSLQFKMTGPATVEGAAAGDAAGYLEYTFTSGQLAVPGTYEAWFSGVDANGQPRTIPEQTKMRLVVVPV